MARAKATTAKEKGANNSASEAEEIPDLACNEKLLVAGGVPAAEAMTVDELKAEMNKAYEQRNLLWQWHLSLPHHPNLIAAAIRHDPSAGGDWPALVGCTVDQGEIAFHVPAVELRRPLKQVLRTSKRWDRSTWKKHKKAIFEFIAQNCVNDTFEHGDVV